MNELLQGQIVKYVTGALMSLLAGTGTCALTGGCTKIKSIGLASDPPIVEVDAFGIKVTARAVTVEFFPDETVEP